MPGTTTDSMRLACKMNSSPEHVQEEVAGFEFVEVDSHGVHQLCTACLCATRTTHTLGDVTLKQYYMNILTEIKLEAGGPILQSPRLCWECVAHLKRSVRFREQVQDSYRLLQQMLVMVDKENLAEFLQTSMSRPARLSTCCAYSIDISPQDDDSQLMTADEDHDDKAAVMEGLENVVASLPSTSRETGAAVDDGSVEAFCDENIGDDRVSEDVDEQLEDSNAQTRKQDTSSDATINITNSTCDESTHELKQMQCNVPPKSFAQKYNLVMHKRTQYANKKRFQCDVCHKSFVFKSALKIHIRYHTGEKPFQCDVCHSSFAFKGKLKNHIMFKHLKMRPQKCKLCPKSYAHRHALRMHIKRFHTSIKVCNVCQETYTELADFQEHKKTHIGQKIHQCQLCPKAYYNNCALLVHMNLHTGEKPFQCEFCRKVFNRNSSLQRHRKIHTGEKPYQCKVCLRTFRQSGTMYTHMSTHTGEKPFQCEVCGQAFSLRYRLLSHVKTHTGEKGVATVKQVKPRKPRCGTQHRTTKREGHTICP